jgi:cob(I)alamin adenosyltransferase
LNAFLGYCRVEAKKNPLAAIKKIDIILKCIQEALFQIQAEIAAVKFNFRFEKRISEREIALLEKEIDDIDKVVPEIKQFVIPGGSELSSRLEIARTLARKAEREIVRFKKAGPEAMKYLNRLSSVLFALSRFANFKLKIKEERPIY